jgi:hypothetical protein
LEEIIIFHDFLEHQEVENSSPRKEDFKLFACSVQEL